jgi:hypothetical protein
MRGPSKFKKTELTRAAKALLAAGVEIGCVEIEPVTGKITIKTSSRSDAEKITDLDGWMAKHARQT